MAYSAQVPDCVLDNLPEDIQSGENAKIFRAAYKQVTRDACLDMLDIHPLDDTYSNIALYVTLQHLHTKTGNQAYYDRALQLEPEVKETAAMEGVDLERLVASRVYFVAAQVKPYAVTAGAMPESKPIALPYCLTYAQAQNMLRVIPDEQELVHSSRYGADGDKMPQLHPVHSIYTIWAEPERVEMLQKTPGNDIVSMPSMAPINPKTISEVDTIVFDDYLNRGRILHEDVASGEKPQHEALRREMDAHVSGMLELQAALSRTPLSQRHEIELHDTDRQAFIDCFAQHGFVQKSPFELTFQEKVLQLAIRELRGACNAATLRHVTQFKTDFLGEFSDSNSSLSTITNGLRQHLSALQNKASPDDKETVEMIRNSARSIVTLVGEEHAETLLTMPQPLTPEQRQYLKVTRSLVPEQLRSEFVIRAAEQMRGLGTEAAVRLTCRTMAKEAYAMGNDMVEAQMNNACSNVNAHYAAYRDAVEQEEVLL